MSKITRPTDLPGVTVKASVGCGNLYIIVNCGGGEPVPLETFITLGKAGGCASVMNEAIGRLISLALQHSVPLEEIVHQLEGLACPSPGLKYKSCPDAVAQVLKDAPERFTQTRRELEEQKQREARNKELWVKSEEIHKQIERGGTDEITGRRTSSKRRSRINRPAPGDAEDPHGEGAPQDQ